MSDYLWVVIYTTRDRQQCTAKAGVSMSLGASDLVQSDGDYTVPPPCATTTDNSVAWKVTVTAGRVILVPALPKVTKKMRDSITTSFRKCSCYSYLTNLTYAA